MFRRTPLLAPGHESRFLRDRALTIEPLRICQVSLVLIFAYQGLVPKLLGPHPDELAMSMALGFSETWSIGMSKAAGMAELALAAAFLVFPRSRWPYLAVLVLMPVFLLYTLWAVPSLSLAAFNPVSTNIAVAALALIGFMSLAGKRQSDI